MEEATLSSFLLAAEEVEDGFGARSRFATVSGDQFYDEAEEDVEIVFAERCLTAEEAALRLAAYGPNLIATQGARSRRCATVARCDPIASVVNVLIIVELVLAIALRRREQRWFNVAVFVAMQAFNIFAIVVEERRSIALLRSSALRDGNDVSQRATVFRVLGAGGAVRLGVPVALLVPGDCIEVTVGDIVPADATILLGGITVDRSGLTGARELVRRVEGSTIYRGAVVTAGEACAIVSTTGILTFVGRRAQQLEDSEPPRKFEKVPHRMALLSLAFASLLALVAAVYIVLAQGDRSSKETGRFAPVLDAIDVVESIVAAAAPMGMKLVCTIIMSAGVRRLASRAIGAVVDSLAMVQELAAMEVVCIDVWGLLINPTLRFVADDAAVVAEPAAGTTTGAEQEQDSGVHVWGDAGGISRSMLAAAGGKSGAICAAAAARRALCAAVLAVDRAFVSRAHSMRKPRDCDEATSRAMVLAALALPRSPIERDTGELVEWDEVDFVPFDPISGRSEATLERRACGGGGAPNSSAAGLFGSAAFNAAEDGGSGSVYIVGRSNAHRPALWPDVAVGDVVSVTQGAPDVVLDMCAAGGGGDCAAIEAAREELAAHTESGCFVVGVARAVRARSVAQAAAAASGSGSDRSSGRSSPRPRSPATDALAPCIWEWVGLVAMKLDVEAEGTAAVAEAHEIGLGVKLVSSAPAAVVRAVLRDLGFKVR
jgi:magnesium-transporting ATPase (P-type)